MTSKIVVNNIESDSGIGSVTFNSDIELGTKNLKGHNLESTGIVTATSFSGSGASLTSLPAGNLTGTLPALDGSALTGVGVGTADSINTSGIITATAFVPTVGQLSHRNIFINGAMTVAQRGVSSTTNGYGSVDRYYVGYNAVQEAPTQAQADISAGTTPYTLGFRKSLKITNGNQTSGAGAGEYIFINMPQEAQNVATSGWNYKSSSSFITLSFWIKSSVAQNFFFQFDIRDGTRQNYTMETGSLTADTWTKITKVIPGNSNLTIDNDNGVGAYVTFGVFWGTNYTASMSLETWGAANDSAKTPVNPTNWYNTNDATLEITGIQLEVGSVATPFEHKSYQDEIMRCYRYYYAHKGMLWGITSAGDHLDLNITFPVPMRAAPSRTQVDTSLLFKNRLNQNNSTSASTYSYSGAVSPTGDFWVARPGSGDSWGIYYTTTESRGIYWHAYEGTTSYAWSAEL